MMYAVVALLLASFLARADIVVEYEGHVTAVRDECWCRPLDLRRGDSVAGRLLIDTDTAPSDSNPDPLGGQYAGKDGPNPNFVTGGHSLIPGRDLGGPDIVAFAEEPADGTGTPPYEGLSLGDGGREGDYISILLGVGRYRAESQAPLFRGDDLAQSFIAGTEEDGATVSGTLWRRLGEFSYTVQFAIDRLTYKPRVCKR